MDCNPIRGTGSHSDGGNRGSHHRRLQCLEKVLFIKFPLIRPYVIYQFILIFAGNVQLFVEPQILGGGNNLGVGGNVPTVWSPNQLAYNFAFEMGNFGAASALSLILLAIGLGAAYLIIRWTGFFEIEK